MKSIKECIGFVVGGKSCGHGPLACEHPMDATSAIKKIVAAETDGIKQIWMNQGFLDLLTIFSAAATKTSEIRLGTAIVQTYPRHPLALAQQVLVLNNIASGRLRLGIGPSHRSIIEGMFGIEQKKPLAHLREYIQVLRYILWEGKVDHHGEFFNVVYVSPNTSRVPILISALGEKAFELAGEIADGSVTWLCPISYLLDRGIPAFRKGATKAGRFSSSSSSTPTLVAHVVVALTTDRQLAIEVGRKLIDLYISYPFYAKMFTNAGFHPSTTITTTTVDKAAAAPDALVDSLIISGDEDTVISKFSEILNLGIDELMVTVLPIKDVDDEQHRLQKSVGRL